MTVVDSAKYANPFWDVRIDAQFTGPNLVQHTVHGFFYDSTLWKVRFAPDAEGSWGFSLKVIRPKDTTTFSGTFTCGPPASHGFLHIDPSNAHMFSFTDGTLFMPHGNVGHTPAVTAALLGIPTGTNQVPAMWDSLQSDGVNTYRITMFEQNAFQDSLSWNTDEGLANLVYQTPALDQYNLRVGKLMDRWLAQAAQHDINIYLCMFTLFDIPAYPFTSSPWAQSNGGPFATVDAPYSTTTGVGADLLRKYYTYVTDRWGAYRNLFAWEYNNEYGVRCSSGYIAMLDSVIRANDPYGHPHSVSFWNASWSNTSAVNGLPGINITDSHLYANNEWTEFNIDSAANTQAVYRYSTYAKPVLFGEFGSGPGLYTPGWVVFQRIGYWAAFVGGGYPVFWLSGDNNASGWDFNRQTIRFVRTVKNVENRLSAPLSLHPSNSAGSIDHPAAVRCYVMTGDSDLVVYLQHFTRHDTVITGVHVTLTIPAPGSNVWSAAWLDPSTGDSLAGSAGVTSNGQITLLAPNFAVDALLDLKFSAAPAGVIADSAVVPSAWELAQNYPNPFNPVTTIRFAVPTNERTRVRVYDVMGREVRTLFDGPAEHGRTYEVPFDASGLASGIYFCRLEAGSLVQTRKMALLR